MASSQNAVEQGLDHPSQPIPNAAYPDAPYQPGSGFHGRGHANGNTAVSTHLAPVLAGNNATPHSTCQPSSSNPSVGSTGPSTWPASIPDVPPPPYVRNEESGPSSWPRIQPRSNRHNAHVHQQTVRTNSVPLQNLSIATTSPGSPSPPSASTTQQEQLPSPHTPSSSSASTSTQAGKLGPVAEARRRRRRRMKLCIVVLSLAVVFVLALILGVALGVLKSTARNDDHKPQYV
jgi:hypothetical protein